MVEPLADWLGEWRLAAGQHHERWDGGGYPNGLAGEDISLAGRIVAVADAYDVITSTRSYKKAMPAEAAREEMVRCAGSQFDPTVVRALLEASLSTSRSRWTAFGWLGELGRTALLPRGVMQGVTQGVGGAVAPAAAAGMVAVVAAASPAPAAVTPFPDGLALVAEVEIDEPTAARPDSTAASIVTDTSTTVAPSTTGSTKVPSTTDTATPATSATSSSTTATTSTATPTTTSTTATTTSTASTTTTTATTATTATTTVTTTAPTTTSSTTTTTTTTTTATTTTTVGGGTTLWYAAGWTADSTPPDLGDLAATVPSTSLPNYDDRDADPGLVLKKGDGLSETAVDKMQRWAREHTSTFDLQGTVGLTLWVATKDFDTGKTGQVEAGLYECNPAGNSCVLLAQGSASFDQADAGSDFAQVDIDVGSVNHSFSSGRSLVIKVAPMSTSDDDLWFAFGTATYPMALTLN
jgi:hypothetical protein